MRFGTDNISSGQQRRLDEAKSSGDPFLLARHLYRMVRDSEAMGETEDIHPDWITLYHQVKHLVGDVYPPSVRNMVTSFFERAGPIVDPQVAELSPKSMTICFLLGAGASKPEPSGIPTVKELLPELLDRARRLDREDVTRLSDFCRSREIENIEDLLTAAQLATFASRNPHVLRLINFLLYREEKESELRSYGRDRQTLADVSSVVSVQETLQVLFGLLSSTMLPARPNPAHAAIAEYAEGHPKTSIITTNYDCCMDQALGKAGDDFTYVVDFANVTGKSPPEGSITRLIKLHGSLNWFYCETCQEVHQVDIATIVSNFSDDTVPYPVIGICKQCRGQRRGLLVPPLAMKFDVYPPLTRLTVEAGAAFGAADLIVVVGFSFADADLYISRMISKSMQTSQDKRLVLVDPEPGVSEKVRKRFEATIPNFDATRIMRITGDCAEMLPKFLRGELLKAGGQAGAQKARSPNTGKR